MLGVNRIVYRFRCKINSRQSFSIAHGSLSLQKERKKNTLFVFLFVDLFIREMLKPQKLIGLTGLYIKKEAHEQKAQDIYPLVSFFDFYVYKPYKKQESQSCCDLNTSMSTGKAPEKSNFSRRCSLLSRYLKEKGSFGNIDIGLARKSDLELAAKSDLRGQQHVIKMAETSKTRPLEFSQKLSVGEASTSSGDKASRDANLSEPASVVPERGNSQLTIFFGGKVVVYNEFPEDKAKEIMEAARELNPVVAVDSENTQNHDMNASNKSSVEIPDLNEPSSSGDNDDQTKQQHQVVERIARRASLHRFFAKRKDRAVARAPYQVNQNGSHLPPKPRMVGPSAEPGQSSRQPASPPKPKTHTDMSMEVDEEEGRCSKDLELKL